MILRSIKVESWRCFADPVYVGPFGDGINVIHGPNAFGKSTIFEALLRGMFDGHRVSGNEVNALRPWGRDLSPRVVVEFSHNGTEYRLEKRFLDQPSSELRRKEGEQFVRLAEGDAADEQIRSILMGSPPGRGLSRPGHWGISQVLWAPQGALEIGELSAGLVANIQESLGVQVSGAGMGPLEKRIRAAYDQYFTPKGKLRSGKDAPGLVSLLARLEELSVEQQAILIRMEEFEISSRRVDDLKAQRAQVRRDVEALSKELREARVMAQDYADLLAREEKRNEQIKSAKARYEELKQRIDSLNTVRKELAEAKETLSQIEAALPVQTKEVEKHETRAAKTKAHLEEGRKGRKQVENARQQAEAARGYLKSAERLVRVEELIRKLRDTEREQNRLKQERIRLVAPDSKKLQAIRKAAKNQDESRVRLEAALITLEIVPEKNMILDILKAEETVQKEIVSGKPVVVKGAPEVVVDLEGIARIRARGPAGSVDDLREKVDRASQRIEKLTSEFGTNDIEKLEILCEKAMALDQKMAETQTRLDTLLSGSTVEEIEKGRARDATLVDQFLNDYPDWRKSPPDLHAILSNSDEIEKAFIDTVEKAEIQWERAQKALRLTSEKRASLQSELNAAQKSTKALAYKETELTGDGQDDSQRREGIRKISLEWDASKAALQDIRKKLEDYAGDPRKVVETLENQLNSSEQAAIQALEKEKSEEGRLQQLASEGIYSALSRVEEEISNLKEEIAGEKLHANAISLLHNTIELCRKKALTAIAGPVENMATRTMHRIAGTRFKHVRLAETFQPEGVAPKFTETPVSIDELSGGEKEQTYLAVRLALAEVLSRKERQLVVLDDILTATDTGRLARILTILEEESRHLQIVILTCHPERYRGMKDVEFFDLERIRKQ